MEPAERGHESGGEAHTKPKPARRRSRIPATPERSQSPGPERSPSIIPNERLPTRKKSKLFSDETEDDGDSTVEELEDNGGRNRRRQSKPGRRGRHGGDDDDGDEDLQRFRPRDRDREIPSSASGARRLGLGSAGSSSARGGGAETGDLQRQVERLQRDLQRKDQELGEERHETERALQRVRKLERERSELNQELEEVRDELNDYVIKFDELKQKQEQDEAERGGGRGSSDSAAGGLGRFEGEPGSAGGKIQELTDVIDVKNHEIAGLLEDLEKMEADKQVLHVTLSEVSDSLQDATNQIEQMSVEHGQFQELLEKSDVKISKLEQEKTILEIKERDLLTFKERHEVYLENLCTAVDVRVDVWKRMMVEKDEEIDRLNIKIAAILAQIPNTQIDSDQSTIRILKQKILDREDQINLLNQQLATATADTESYTKTIQELRNQLSYTESNNKTQKLISSLQAKLKKYQSTLHQRNSVIHSYEKEIEDRTREITSLSTRLHEYETGQYGLAEAISESKEAKGQVRIRDKQIEGLTQDVNIIQLQKEDLADENELLRHKLGLKGGTVTDEEMAGLRKETAEFVQSRQSEIGKLKAKIRSLENEFVQVKSKNYSLRKECTELMLALQQQEEHHQHSESKVPIPLPRVKRPRSHSLSPSPPSSERKPRSRDTMKPSSAGRSRTSENIEIVRRKESHSVIDSDADAEFVSNEWKEKYEVILDENTELRKGLVEILDSMRRLSDESTSNVLIESPILENLLREMSARGLINYPYPISGFHLKVCNLEGKNSQLRDEIHRLRDEKKRLRNELFDAKVQFQQWTDQLSSQPAVQTEPIGSTPEITAPSTNLVLADLQRLEQKAAALEEAGFRHELFADLRELVGQLITISQGKVTPGTETSTATSGVSFRAPTKTPSPVRVRSCNQFIQTEECALDMLNANQLKPQVKSLSQIVQTEESLCELYNSQVQINQLKTQVKQLETLLNAKDQVLAEFKVIRVESFSEGTRRTHPETLEALQVAQDSIKNLQDRLKVKEENLLQYRKLLAEVRSEMSAAAERHVEEMKALQLTVHQQQQAFTRMKSTLSQPVKDTHHLNFEGALKDQLTRIHELEDEVSELQHTLGNVASQLTTARSDAQKWRTLADSRLKEVDQAREHLTEETLEELKFLRERLRHQEELLREFRIVRPSSTDGGQMTNEDIRKESEIIQLLRKELAERDKKLESYEKTIKSLKKGGPGSAKAADKQITSQQSQLIKDKENHELKEANRQLQQKISTLTLKISKINAVNQASGASAEVVELRTQVKALQDERMSLQKRLDENKLKVQEDEEKRRKQIDSLARWDEGKKWKKTIEKLESRVQELEIENEKLSRTNQSFRLLVSRFEKEKLQSQQKTKLTKSKDSILGTDETATTDESSASAQQSQKFQADQMKLENYELKEAIEKAEFESHEQIEKLKMEIRVLKERIVSQERQITAYQVAQKGDPKIISEIEKMVKNEEVLQKEVLRLEEDNLHLNLQLEQLKMDTPRLRDRVQHLQKLVDVLKTERSMGKQPSQQSSTRPDTKIQSYRASSCSSQKSLGELERTITALKTVIDKLQTENKKLKVRPPPPNVVRSCASNIVASATKSSEKLKSSVTSLMEEKQLLVDQLHELEHEKRKYHQMYLDSVTTIDNLQVNLADSEKKAKSAEMKLKTFLQKLPGSSDDGGVGIEVLEPSGGEKMFHYMRDMQEKLERKEKLLNEAKEALREAAGEKHQQMKKP